MSNAAFDSVDGRPLVSLDVPAIVGKYEDEPDGFWPGTTPRSTALELCLQSIDGLHSLHVESCPTVLQFSAGQHFRMSRIVVLEKRRRATSIVLSRPLVDN